MDIIDDFNTSVGSGIAADFFPVFKYIPTPGLRILKKGMNLALNMIRGFMKDHRKNFDPGEQRAKLKKGNNKSLNLTPNCALK